MGFSEKRECQTNLIQQFQPFQIVCLEYETSRLYAEVVQIIEKRQVCWVHPLVLVVEDPNDSTDNSSDRHNRAEFGENFYDLRQGADLLFPAILFRTALDTEVLPLINFLYCLGDRAGNSISSLTSGNGEDQSGHQRFRQFIQQVWKAYPEAF
ncbi:hypothetical protein K9N68_01830 [Kovacikia minuta CCNUW1]|uniref:hypothetical protein n=1 Tax=Kovacikia minuta TaxID=2931930 RepID=UPI001CCD684C|nr:hypothetical protein [Kovacikia minuta]UBF26764.1 hypothetical protein K9N68_01830 [Kovacikia minuta CCNUW1]